MADIHRFNFGIEWELLPVTVQKMARRCLLDTLGVALAASQTEAAAISARFALSQLGATSGSRSSLIGFDGGCSAAGAALAGGLLVDSLDAHDGHRLTKGHAGASVIPALLSLSSHLSHQGRMISGKTFLEALVVGYEIALRTGIELHKRTRDYPSSGAWTAVGVAAMGAKLLGMSTDQFDHALGIAEYYGPRSPMMRCIDHPTMLKDGAGWGAMAGISAVFLAQSGFTGAPATTINEADRQDYFHHYEMLDQYFKPWPVCRWAQPALEAVVALTTRHSINVENIEAVEVRTFHEAMRLGNEQPESTESAQYAIGFPVAALLINGKLGVEEVTDAALTNPAIKAMQERIYIQESEVHNKAFPAKRYASVCIRMHDKSTFDIENVEARGDAHNPLSDRQIMDKFIELTGPVLSADQQTRLSSLVATLETSTGVSTLLDIILGRIH
ncbi:MAG: hypothetical protein MAG794_01330 [Gammaproteobacteria bacterium]|nr:hypothetical protein [Gammaproteobacteria bacterium]